MSVQNDCVYEEIEELLPLLRAYEWKTSENSSHRIIVQWLLAFLGDLSMLRNIPEEKGEQANNERQKVRWRLKVGWRIIREVFDDAVLFAEITEEFASQENVIRAKVAAKLLDETLVALRALSKSAGRYGWDELAEYGIDILEDWHDPPKHIGSPLPIRDASRSIQSWLCRLEKDREAIPHIKFSAIHFLGGVSVESLRGNGAKSEDEQCEPQLLDDPGSLKLPAAISLLRRNFLSDMRNVTALKGLPDPFG